MTKKHAYVSGTGGEYRLVLDREALDAFGVSRLQVCGDGARAMPTTFRKFRPVQALANAINQYMAPKAEVTPQQLMEQAVKAGATFSDYMEADAKINPLSDEDLALIDRARELYESAGDLEFNDLCVVSGSEEPTGDYVLCWKWVNRP